MLGAYHLLMGASLGSPRPSAARVKSSPGEHAKEQVHARSAQSLVWWAQNAPPPSPSQGHGGRDQRGSDRPAPLPDSLEKKKKEGAGRRKKKGAAVSLSGSGIVDNIVQVFGDTPGSSEDSESDVR